MLLIERTPLWSQRKSKARNKPCRKGKEPFNWPFWPNSLKSHCHGQDFWQITNPETQFNPLVPSINNQRCAMSEPMSLTSREKACGSLASCVIHTPHVFPCPLSSSKTPCCALDCPHVAGAKCRRWETDRPTMSIKPTLVQRHRPWPTRPLMGHRILLWRPS